MTEAIVRSMHEVHRWRGTPEQRAVRDRVRKFGQFAYFDRQLGHPDWRGRAVLDFGGGDGNLLRNGDCAIDFARYWCLDVVKEAVDEGRDAFPRGHWIHYDRYNCSFNPGGVRGLPLPDLGVRFDFILAYSVFTHTAPDELRELVPQLRARLAPGGALAFTFEDPRYPPCPEVFDGNNVEWRLERSRPALGDEVDRVAAAARGAEWCALVDGASLDLTGAIELECLTYDVYFTTEWMQRAFPDAEILAPVNGEMQHCCVIRNR